MTEQTTTEIFDVERGHAASAPLPPLPRRMSPPTRRRMSSTATTGSTDSHSLEVMGLCEYQLSLQNNKNNSDPTSAPDYDRYKKSHPLVYAMMQGKAIRTRQLEQEGAQQIQYPKSSQGWWTTLRIVEGRALKSVAPVWCLVVLHAVAYTCCHELIPDLEQSAELSSWEIFFGIALNATLSLMLVFRLNRAAARWWLARQQWGLLVAKMRALTSGLLVHGGHDPVHRDHAIRWTAAFALAVMEFLRGCQEMDCNLFEGILTSDEVAVLQEQSHPPLFAAEQIRHFLKCLFCVTESTPAALSIAYSQQMATMEEQWTDMLDQCGGMERIKATPLPIVYVSHLRTFLILSLLLYPYVWGHEWGWSTIPIVALAAFSMLGIEAASVEVEQPFKKDRVNALNMDGFCIGALSNIEQLIRQHADRELAKATCG